MKESLTFSNNIFYIFLWNSPKEMVNFILISTWIFWELYEPTLAALLTLEYFQSCHKENLYNITITSKAFLKTVTMIKNVHFFLLLWKKYPAIKLNLSFYFLYWKVINPFTANAPYHIETNQLICIANQLIGFYVMGNVGR